jgi:hypothetical protein
MLNALGGRQNTLLSCNTTVEMVNSTTGGQDIIHMCVLVHHFHPLLVGYRHKMSVLGGIHGGTVVADTVHSGRGRGRGGFGGTQYQYGPRASS